MPDALLETNLFLTFGELAQRLLDRARRVATPAVPVVDSDVLLDCYLVAAGLSQILEDHLHRDVLSLGAIATQLDAIRPGGPLAGRLLRAAARGANRLRAWLPGARRLGRRQRALATIVARLARRVTAPTHGRGLPALDAADVRAVEAVLADWGSFPPRLRHSVQRVPNCFRSFDQQPDDCRRLVERFAERWPRRERPLLVVGLRTSGSYLAPLVAAFLERAGYRDVAVCTLRPSQFLGREEIATARRLAAAGGLALLVDDPPKTGAQLARAAAVLAALGVEDIALLVQVPEPNTTLPEMLRHLPAVVLPGPDWAIRERLAPQAIQATLRDVLVDRRIAIGGAEVPVAKVTVTAVTQLPPRRGHTGARVEARMVDRTSGAQHALAIYVKGVGLGYFGRHAQCIAAALDPAVPPVLGVRHGLLFRLWLPEETRVTPERLRSEGDEVARAIARYVATRGRILGVPEDFCLRLQRLGAVWDHVGHMLGAAFGWARHLLRPLMFLAAKRLVRTAHPSVTDARTGPWEWYGERGGPWRKTDFHQRASSNVGLRSCDPVFDLAEAAATAEAARDPTFGARLKRDYERLTGERVDEERWYLYRLLHHLEAYRTAHLRRSFQRVVALEQTMADVHQRYFETRYFDDLTPLRAGPICAIDVDGVLETRWLAFPAIGPAGAAALRALAVHGYRALLVTGRSLDEVAARCRAFRLAGGVAEYGSVVYDHCRGRAHSLLTRDDTVALTALRAALDGDDVFIDPTYRHSVRAHRFDPGGQRKGLRPETVARALTRAGVEGQVRAVHGGLQTDFVAARSDKGRGLQALLQELDEGDGASPVALAVGDTASDLPMFALAAHAVAPANGARELRGRVAVAHRPRGAGLKEAVDLELGHGAHCRVCRPPTPKSRSATVLQIAMRALDGGRLAKLQQAAALFLTVTLGA